MQFYSHHMFDDAWFGLPRYFTNLLYSLFDKTLKEVINLAQLQVEHKKSA